MVWWLSPCSDIWSNIGEQQPAIFYDGSGKYQREFKISANDQDACTSIWSGIRCTETAHRLPTGEHSIITTLLAAAVEAVATKRERAVPSLFQSKRRGNWKVVRCKLFWFRKRRVAHLFQPRRWIIQRDVLKYTSFNERAPEYNCNCSQRQREWNCI